MKLIDLEARRFPAKRLSSVAGLKSRERAYPVRGIIESLIRSPLSTPVSMTRPEATNSSIGWLELDNDGSALPDGAWMATDTDESVQAGIYPGAAHGSTTIESLNAASFYTGQFNFADRSHAATEENDRASASA